MTEDDMRMHLRLYHGEYIGDVKTMSGLVACHELTHEDDGSSVANPAYVPHTHTNPIPPTPAEEWSW